MGSLWGVQRRGFLELVMANTHDCSMHRASGTDSARLVGNSVVLGVHILFT